MNLNSMLNTLLRLSILPLPLLVSACGDEKDPGNVAVDPDDAPVVEVDRFSASAGMLQVRSATNGLPGSNDPIDFDQGPFITSGLGPAGQKVQYYNFDVRPVMPAPIYVLFRDGETGPVADQLNVIDTIPGETGYNDFWQVTRVTVPMDYVANSVTSLEEIRAAGYAMSATEMLVNCPVVPAGSTATHRLNGESTALSRGWYRGQVVNYFNFSERSLMGSSVPVAPIYVTFNVNPPAGGPPSGFKTESGAAQTHNVLAALPGDGGYSPLWSVSPYDNSNFDSVRDLPSARAARSLGEDVATVNCPVVTVSK